MNINKTIVSICIITYNSSNTIIELLNSILYQSYGAENIELVISDDKSQDSTVQVIETWLRNHKAAFFDVVFNINKENLGISKNFEVTLSLSTAEYIKTIAGDDILKTQAIESYINFIKKAKSNIIFSKVEAFSYSNEKKIIHSICPNSNENIKSFNLLSAKLQFERIFLRKKEITFKNNNYILPAPTLFFKRNLLHHIINSPKGRNMEDYPTWLFLTGVKGEKIKVSTEILVEYRTNTGISFSYKKSLENKNSNLKDSIFIKKYFVRYLGINKKPIVYISIVNLYFKLFINKIKISLKN
ncbi:glycosyltransferase family 2 protein [Candidatus Francisella endociliophora]|uniref:glycosyltransferase family 2 protein n=1 Tax=Candidatus Francisella endociliophora TaxID=653937 RepID=UPI000694494B|nr:glycosyltransferase [Francisella sp. FSC1006]